MGKFRAVARREYLERIRSRWFVFATCAGPLFFGALIIVPLILTRQAPPSEDVSRIVILDATASGLGARVARALGGGPQGDTLTAIVRAVGASALPAAEDSATHEVMRHERIGYLALDSAALKAGIVYYAGRNAGLHADLDLLASVVRQSLLAQRLERAGVNPAQIGSLTTFQPRLITRRITDRALDDSGELSAYIAYAMGFTLYAMIVIWGNSILRSVIEEKSSRVAEVVVASVPPRTLLAGKVLGVSAVAFTQVVVWVALSTLVYHGRGLILDQFGIDSPAISFPTVGLGTLIALILLLVLGFLAYAALFAGVGAIVGNQEDAQQAALPVTMVVICAVVLIPPVLMNPNGTLARITSWFPFSAPILMPVRMSVVQVPRIEIAGTLLGVAIGCAAAVLIAARIYRIGLLMYGKRPALREVLRWVRQ